MFSHQHGLTHSGKLTCRWYGIDRCELWGTAASYGRYCGHCEAATKNFGHSCAYHETLQVTTAYVSILLKDVFLSKAAVTITLIPTNCWPHHDRSLCLCCKAADLFLLYRSIIWSAFFYATWPSFEVWPSHVWPRVYKDSEVYEHGPAPLPHVCK